MFVDEWYGLVTFFSVFFIGMTSLVYTTCVGVRRSRCNVIKCGDCILCLREIMTKDEMIVDGVITNKEGEQRLKEKELDLQLAQAKDCRERSPTVVINKEDQTHPIEIDSLTRYKTLILSYRK